MPDNLSGADIIIIEVKCLVSVLCLNHPQTISPYPVCGKIAFHETSPFCQKGQGLLLYRVANGVSLGFGQNSKGSFTVHHHPTPPLGKSTLYWCKLAGNCFPS